MKLTTKDEKFYSTIGKLGGGAKTEKTSKRGFASMSPEKRREVAAKGGSSKTER